MNQLLLPYSWLRLSPCLLLSVASLPLATQAQTPTAAATPVASAQAVPIRGFSVLGDNPLSEGVTSSVLAPYLRRPADLETLRQATQALEAALRDAGFGLYKVGLVPQALDAQAIQLQVVKFKIGQVTVEGNQRFTSEELRRALPELQEGTTPQLQHLAIQSLIANESIGKRTTVVLRESEQPDAIDAVIRVREAPKSWAGAISISNGGSKETGRDRVIAAMNHSDLWGRDHQADLALTTSLHEPQAVRQIGLGYRIPAYTLRGVWQISASYSTVKGDFGAFTTAGASRNWSLGYTQHLGLVGEYRQLLSVRLDDKTSLPSTVNGTQVSAERRSRPVVLGYSLSGDSSSHRSVMSAELALNSNSGQHNDLATYQTEDARISKSSWQALRASITHNRNLGSWGLTAKAQAQAASTALISAEQLSVGGLGYVKGSPSVSSDGGLATSLELQSPAWSGLRFLVGLDSAWLSNRAISSTKPGSDRLTSASLGLRYSHTNGLFASLDYGYLLNSSQQSLVVNPSAPQKGAHLTYVNFGWRF
jgi:hemolysin activation/secretion protein